MLLLIGGCFSEPSYEGRRCDPSSPCPDDLRCVEGMCRLLIAGPPAADASAPADGAVQDGGAALDAQALQDAAALDAAPADAAMAPDSGAALCTLGETRACYSGPSGSAGVGTCREGVRTCDGTDFGPCTGEVLPEAETCDGRDQSCDRVIDNGCPSGAVALAARIDTELVGWLPFGDTWAGEGCLAGDVVVGFYGHYDEFLNEVGEHCDTPRVTEDSSSNPHRYALELVPSTSALPRGGAMGTAFTALCPPGQVVVGVSGRAGSWIDQLSFTCAALELIDRTQAHGAPSFEIREVPGSRALVSLEAGGPGGGPFELVCPDDFAATERLLGALGSTTCCPSLVTTLGLECSQLEVSLR